MSDIRSGQETAGGKNAGQIKTAPLDPDAPGVEVADVSNRPTTPLVPPPATASASDETANSALGAGWYLVSLRGAMLGRRYPLGETARIGRSPELEIPVNDGKVSRTHARLDRQGDIYRLTDLDSTNGTFVNNYRISRPVFLQSEDVIRVGDTQLQLKNE